MNWPPLNWLALWECTSARWPCEVTRMLTCPGVWPGVGTAHVITVQMRHDHHVDLVGSHAVGGEVAQQLAPRHVGVSAGRGPRPVSTRIVRPDERMWYEPRLKRTLCARR